MREPSHEPVRSRVAPRPHPPWRPWLWVYILACAWVPQAHAQVQCVPLSCLVPHAGNGCDDVTCCETICQFDPTCCENGWDAHCVTLAHATCQICGASGTGSCYSAHSGASCADAACCATVCSIDPFCCDESWDVLCAILASSMCQGTVLECGDPQAGDCHAPHASTACADATCCEAVCALAPECCQNSWDFICAGIADSICLTGACPVDCSPTAGTHGEGCVSYDASCGQPATVIAPGGALCGTLPVTDGLSDLDVYSVVVSDIDGDGVARVTLTLESAGPAFAALVQDSCSPWGPSPLVVQTELCGPVSAAACVEAGAWVVVVSPGVFPTPDHSQRLCAESQYELSVDVNQICGEPCGIGEPCDVPHAGPGCLDGDCCQAVCAIDPLCCSLAWDTVCVKATVANCSVAPPSYDDCANAAVIGEGTFDLQHLAATLDGPALPPGCTPGGAKNVQRDLWCRVTGVRGTVLISTCGGEEDPTLQLYEGTCASLALVYCAVPIIGQCPSGDAASAIQVSADCSDEFLIRVGFVPGQVGSAVLTVDGIACVSCDADLDASGDVDGTDMAVVLGNWGGQPSGGGDVDADGLIDGADLAAILGAWGPCP